MKKQLHPQRKLEKQRGLFFRIGLVISLFITFLAFEWETKLPRIELSGDPIIPEEFEPVINTWTKPDKPIPEPKIENKKKLRTIIDTELKIVPDATPIDSSVIDSTVYTELNPVEPKPEPVIDDDIPWMNPEVMPSFHGGEKALLEFIISNTRFPEKARKNGIEGLVYLNFVIDKDGKVTDIETKYASSRIFEEEAIRVIKLMPSWKPGKQGGIPVRVRMALPFSFKLK